MKNPRKIRSRMQQSLVLLSAALVLPVTSLLTKEIAWAGELTGESLPDKQDALWFPQIEGGVSAVEDNLLVMNSNEGNIYWVLRDAKNVNWDATMPTTVEFRARAREVAPGFASAGQVAVCDGTQSFAFNISDTEWHTYRMVINAGQGTLYIDGDLASATPLKAQPLPQDYTPIPGCSSNFIYFGDASGNAGGVSEWEFLRWTNQGAFEH